MTFQRAEVFEWEPKMTLVTLGWCGNTKYCLNFKTKRVETYNAYDYACNTSTPVADIISDFTGDLLECLDDILEWLDDHAS